MVTFDFFLLRGSEFWIFLGSEMNSFDQILINFPKKSCLPQELLWFILAAPKNSKRKAWLKPSQSCCHQSYPKSAKSLFGHPDYITDQKPETECVNLYCKSPNKWFWVSHFSQWSKVGAKAVTIILGGITWQENIGIFFFWNVHNWETYSLPISLMDFHLFMTDKFNWQSFTNLEFFI